MSQNLTPYAAEGASVSQLEVITTETIATSVRSEEVRRPRRAKKKGGFSLFWGISGGSILGALGFVALTLYQQYNDSLMELQRDLKHFNTTCADLVKKDDFNGRSKVFWNRIEKLEKGLADKSERVVLLEHLLKSSEEERKELVHEVQLLRERLAGVEGRQSVIVPGQLKAGD